MSAIAAVLILPVTGFSHTRFRSSTKISALRVDFPPRKSVHWESRTRRSSSMTSAVEARIDAVDHDHDVRHASLEQEALVNGSLIVAASGFEATLNNLSKWLFAVLFGITVLWTHDARALWASIGSVLNSVLSHILKRTLNHKRPVPTSRSDPGMPSSHAQSIFYIITFTIISMIQCFGLTGLTAALSGLTVALGCYFSWLRITQKFHTSSQVLVGATIGFGFCIFWSWLWDAIMLKAFVSFFWVRITVVLAAAGLCSSFLIYVIRYWVLDEH